MTYTVNEMTDRSAAEHVPDGLSADEHAMAARNTSLSLEALELDVTPIGMHYTLCHFDIPFLDPADWRLTIVGRNTRTITLDELRSLPRVEKTVTMECAGNGRSSIHPRPRVMPWRTEGVGTARWSGAELAPLLTELGVDDAVEVVFAGVDEGYELGSRHTYERSMPVEDALGGGLLLAYEMNGQPRPPQHGAPVRLVVPRWYGMASVKWLSSIRTVATPFEGPQQVGNYRIRTHPGELGEPVNRMRPRSLMRPVGLPMCPSMRRAVEPGTQTVRGRAWSGQGDIVKVEFSDDGGQTFVETTLGPAVSVESWRSWSVLWTPPATGAHRLCSRATDSAGNVQPLEPFWNELGVVNNSVQFVDVEVA